MARQATIIDRIEDAWGDLWDVREYRSTPHGFDVAMGWPSGQERGRGRAGGPRAIITAQLRDYLEALRGTRQPLQLPIGSTTIKRIRRVLGHNGYIDRATWWEARADDLSDMTVAEFSAAHAVSAGATVNARHALFGATLRPAGWWREPDVASRILADEPRTILAEDLGISVGALGRLRWQLKRDISQEDKQ